ncbi:MAG: sugar phosphate nucleotidyltransferase [bacterium]|nr:sugar phosphate nucleotidyltransferase [bacterium]
MIGLSDGWAVIPAAGVGSRLRPHTHTTPKALLPVAGKPILGYILDEVVRLGIDKVALVVGHLGDRIVQFVKKTYSFSQVVPVIQNEPQGLGQAVYLTRKWVDGAPLLIVYGDTVFEGDLMGAARLKADAAIGVRQVEDPRRFGVVQVEGQKIVRLVEKPEEFISDLAIVGVNLIQRSELLFSCLQTLVEKDIRTRGELQLTDAFGLMVEAGAHLEMFPVEHWFDCGAPESLLETNRHLLGRHATPCQREGAILIPPVFVAESATVKNSILGPYVSVGDDAEVTDALVRDSIIGEGAKLSGCFLERSLVGSKAVVEAGPRRLNVGDSSEVSLY